MNRQMLEQIEIVLEDSHGSRFINIGQPDVGSDINIITQKIGKDLWIHLFEDYSKTEWHRVNLSGQSLKELYKILKEEFEG